jgi:hypothetical protein
MRTVCYIVHTAILTQGEDPQVNENIFFGPVDEVTKELKELQKSNAQAQITHAKDNGVLAQLKNKEQILSTLTSHDLDKLPVFPQFATGQGQCRFECYPSVAFINNIKVSIRGTKAANEPKALTILLPPGVRVD